MFFTTKAIIALLSIIQVQIQASFIADSEQDLVVINIETIDDITLTWYGDALPAKRSALAGPAEALNIRSCGTNDLTCTASDGASTVVCNSLIKGLKGNNHILSSSPRAVCTGQGSDQCCTSWSKAVNGTLRDGKLWNAADQIHDRCANPDVVSGLALNVNLAGTCVTQCLSKSTTCI